MADNDSEKTESPTPRKLQEARQDGNVARSTDLTAAVSLLAAMLLLHYFGMRVMTGWKATVETMFTSGMSPNPTRAGNTSGMLAYALRVGMAGVAPIILCMLAVTLVAAVSQVGFMVTGKPLTPQLSRMSPLAGVKRLFDARAGIRLVMSLGKTIVIAFVAVWVILGDLPLILMLPQLEVRQIFTISAELVFGLAIKLCALLLTLAILDYAFQRFQREKDLRMSKQEIREEMKRMEGDPLVKQRRARVAKQLAMQRIGQAVPSADVVVTNPTHYAIALRYDNDSMHAPKVVAKGADFMALRIRQLAIANGVPMVERKELARALYRSVEPGQEIPAEFYNAVAEILAYVYRLSGKRSA